MSEFVSSMRAPTYGAFWICTVVVLFMLLDCVPGIYVTAPHISPALFLIPVFYAAVFAERPMTPVIILFLGLFRDFLAATPIGFWALVLCGFYGVAYIQRQFVLTAGGQSGWLVFATLCLGIFCVSYLMGFFVDMVSSPALANLGSLLLTVLAYPIVMVFFRFNFSRRKRQDLP